MWNALHVESGMAARAEKMGRLATGFSLLVAGAAMLVLPGPGLVTMLGALALLSKDLQWAKDLRSRVFATVDHASTLVLAAR